MKTVCCDYEVKDGDRHPVFFNPGNNTVQCHNCGEIYGPMNEVGKHLVGAAKWGMTQAANVVSKEYTSGSMDWLVRKICKVRDEDIEGRSASGGSVCM